MLFSRICRLVETETLQIHMLILTKLAMAGILGSVTKFLARNGREGAGAANNALVLLMGMLQPDQPL